MKIEQNSCVIVKFNEILRVLTRVVHDIMIKNEVQATDQDTLQFCSIW